jgi:hypothetical protein
MGYQLRRRFLAEAWKGKELNLQDVSSKLRDTVAIEVKSRSIPPI